MRDALRLVTIIGPLSPKNHKVLSKVRVTSAFEFTSIYSLTDMLVCRSPGFHASSQDLVLVLLGL